MFVGEESRGKIIGLHNWIQVYLEEKKGNIDYLGWTGRQDKHDDGVTLATIKFAWADDKPGEVTIKPVSTILVGATPEFEVAALSLAFLCGEQEGDNRTEAVWKSTSELGYNVASMAWGGRTLIST